MSRLLKSVKVVPNVVPMIDIVSQLVIFFMLASQFISADTDTAIQLPDLDHSMAQSDKDVNKLIINLKPDPADPRRLGDITIGMTSLFGKEKNENRPRREILLEIIQIQQKKATDRGGGLTLVIRADKRLPWEEVQKIMFLAGEAKIKDVRLTAPIPVAASIQQP